MTSRSEDRLVAVVTGAGNGLGAVIAAHLHRTGHRVAVVDVDEAAAKTVAGDLDGTGETARAYGVDVTDREAIEGLLAALLESWGDVQVLVNNAARTQSTPLLEISAEELASVMAVNIGGTFAACQVFGRHMVAAGYGRIVNLGSLAGQNGGTATGGHYASSKGAVLAATKVFARELASSGVTVNAVSPGPSTSRSYAASSARTTSTGSPRPSPWAGSAAPSSSPRWSRCWPRRARPR